MGKPHLLMLVPNWPDDKNLFHGRFFKEQAMALRQEFSVSVLYPKVHPLRVNTRDFVKIDQTAVSDGLFEVTASVCAPMQRFAAVNRIALNKAFDAGISHILREKGPVDFVFAQTGFPQGEMAYRYHHKHGVPFSILDHYSFAPAMFFQHKKSWPVVYKAAGFRAAVSPSLQRVVRICTDFRFDVAVLPNCLDERLINRPILPFQREKYMKWIFIGRDHPVKQPSLLLEAFALTPPNHSLSIVGLGTSFEYLPSIPSQLKERIRLLPAMTATDLWTEMEKHTALICTSSIETFGMAPLEMLALGRPVVSTPCGGPEGFVNDENGIICDDFSADSILDAMSNLESRLHTLNPQSIAETVRNRFSPQAFARTFKALVQPFLPS